MIRSTTPTPGVFISELPLMEPKLYYELASWWPILSAPQDYAEEAEVFRKTLVEACNPKDVLELGCGGGNNASHMKAHFKLTLTDLSPGMLEVSEKLNPECEHLQGDMRTLRLDRRFDAVFVHDAVTYMSSEEDLDAAIATASLHCKPGGAALFFPDYFRETFAPSTKKGGHDGEGRSLRYLEWTYDPDSKDTTVTVDFAYMLRSGASEMKVVYDRHITGLFERETWLRLCRATGLIPELSTFTLSDPEPLECEMILCRKEP
ncbi:class I SAM-dependent methyltransferase [Acidobacteriota bacterium]